MDSVRRMDEIISRDLDGDLVSLSQQRDVRTELLYQIQTLRELRLITNRIKGIEEAMP